MADTINFAVEKPTVGGYRNTWGGTLNTALDKITELIALALPIGSIQMYTKSTPPTATASGGTWLVCNGTAISRTTYSDLFAVLSTTYGVGDNNTTFNLPDMRARVPMGYNAGTLGSGATARTAKVVAASAGEETHILSEAELEQHSHSIPLTTHTHGITDVTHTHSGSDSGKTASATAVISDPQHDHASLTQVTSWMGGGDYASAGTHIGQAQPQHRTASNSTGITDQGHAHSFSTTAEGTGLSATDAGLTNITATGNTGSNTAHNNQPPYLVVNYIILAKHPTFA
tara:strand:- start:306 stop:1166 length:861 start_codon:yes stop_codon:yes gene_type:complete